MTRTRIVNFLELTGAFDLAPEQAVAFFQRKGLRLSFAWQDVIGDEHDTAFTVAKLMDADLLATVKDKLDRAVATGSSLADFKRDLIPTLQAAGWWGKRDVVDPLTGQVVKAQLGSASRLETIFRTNVQNAYAAGHWRQIQENRAEAPYLLYDAVDDHRTRPEHAELDGTVLPIADKFWKTHYPPNGWNCRCGVIQMSAEDLEDYGLSQTPRPRTQLREWKNPRTGETRLVPSDLDPGWDHNPGIGRKKRARQIGAEKGVKVPPVAPPAPVAPLAPAAPLIPAYVPASTLAKAKKLTQEIVDAQHADYVMDPGDGGPAVRFRHGRESLPRHVRANRYGKADINGLDLETANALNEWLPEAQALCDTLGIPRLRGVTTQAPRGSLGAMGDGVLAVHKNNTAREPVSGALRANMEQGAIRYRALPVDAPTSQKPSVSGQYFATAAERFRAVLWHEFGHHVHQQLRARSINDYRSPPLESRLRALFAEHDGFGRKLNAPSQYATTNEREFWAECFALYKMGLTSVLPRFIVDAIEAVLRGEMP